MEKDEVKDKQTWKQTAGYDVLATHIIKQAVYDYNQAKKKKDFAAVASLQRFFRSEWCQLLCNIDGEVLIEAAEKVHEEVIQGRRRDAKIKEW